MSISKENRTRKQKLGQFFTPASIARNIVENTIVLDSFKILEPSFGNGSFVFAILDKLKKQYDDIIVKEWSKEHLYGCEMDSNAYQDFIEKWGKDIPSGMRNCDFFRFDMPSFSRKEYFSGIEEKYDLIIGNPPFGGTFDIQIQDELDSIFGTRNGEKIKKETYAFFIVKCIDLLKVGGNLVFICSDTMLSINTMRGLRKLLVRNGSVTIERLPGDFDETVQSMIVLRFCKGGSGIKIFGQELLEEEISRSQNYSFSLTNEYINYFTGVTLGDYMIASSGMTVGCNELFIREINQDKIEEPYEFEITERPITLEREIQKARLGKLSTKQRLEIMAAESRGDKEKFVLATKRTTPITIQWPNCDYAPYNKATNQIIYSEPTHAIFWKNEGEYVYTFKKSGNWYLHGVGGKPFFKREGLTWQLISSKLHIRYLPEGYILDSGAPCAFMRENTNRDEMYFIMAWCLTKKCNEILKTVINHTRNIQSKDFERLPYPSWVDDKNKAYIIGKMKNMLHCAMNGEKFTHDSQEIIEFDELFVLKSIDGDKPIIKKCKGIQLEFNF